MKQVQRITKIRLGKDLSYKGYSCTDGAELVAAAAGPGEPEDQLQRHLMKKNRQ
ncbi:MAG: hypothetical protein R2744_11520 [Bacteroidales bacterium]